MKPMSYYDTVNISLPSRDEFTDVFVYSKGAVVWQGPFKLYKPQAEGNFKGMLVEKVVNEEGLKAQRAAHHLERQRLDAEFKADLLEDNGVTGHPKADLAFSMAMQRYHGYGNRQDAADYFEELVQLIKD